MRSEQEVIDQLKHWADAQPNVRTLILTSSRADPHRQPDLLSDYDVEVFVRDLTPFTADDAWVRTFGKIMVRWPMTPRPTFSDDWITQLVLYEDGTRIDFQVTSLPPSAGEDFDSGYRVLMDKDNVAATLPEPTHTEYRIQLPTAEAFGERINAFWWDIVYIAKALRRGELNYAKHMMEGPVRARKLQPLIEWYIALSHEEPVKTGLYGRWFHQYLTPDLWSDYLRTFAGAEFADNWRALNATLAFVRKLGHAIARTLEVPYPEATDRKVTNYIEWIRDLDQLR
jgi:aminoglycoside 6-adenylyltransferase